MEKTNQFFLHEIIKDKPLICKNGGIEQYFLFQEYKDQIINLFEQSNLEKQAEIINVKVDFYLKNYMNENDYSDAFDYINYLIEKKEINDNLKEYLIDEIKIIKAAQDMYKLTLKRK